MSRYTRDFNNFSRLSRLCPCSNAYASYLFSSSECPFSSIPIQVKAHFDICSSPFDSVATAFRAIDFAPCSVIASLTDTTLAPHYFIFAFALSVLLLVLNPVSVSCHSGESQILGLRRP